MQKLNRKEFLNSSLKFFILIGAGAKVLLNVIPDLKGLSIKTCPLFPYLKY